MRLITFEHPLDVPGWSYQVYVGEGFARWWKLVKDEHGNVLEWYPLRTAPSPDG